VDPIEIHRDVLAKIFGWTRAVDIEVSGLGLIEQPKPGKFKIVEAFLLPQEGDGGSTELDDDGVAKLMFDLAKEDREDLLRFWWHSHVRMEVFWSTVDTDNIDRLCQDDFLISLVVNQHGHMLTRVDFARPARMYMNDIPLKILWADTDLQKSCKEETDAKVRVIKPKIPTYGGKSIHALHNPRTSGFQTIGPQHDGKKRKRKRTKGKTSEKVDSDDTFFAEEAPSEVPYLEENITEETLIDLFTASGEHRLHPKDLDAASISMLKKRDIDVWDLWRKLDSRGVVSVGPRTSEVDPNGADDMDVYEYFDRDMWD
jgi:hypothetical protein